MTRTATSRLSADDARFGLGSTRGRAKLLCLLAALNLSMGTAALAESRREIEFPDILGFKTLKCDLHTHTVFSDGVVWPTVRVEEAWREGLDGLAITDHIEYQPHSEDVNTDLNRPYEVAAPRAKTVNLLLPKGTEITRDTPPGHFNALFLSDVTPLRTDDFVDVIRTASEQGGFVFWNHPGWQGPELGDWREIHEHIYKEGWLHGVEVVNGGYYYAEAHQWCLDKDITMMGNSDIHSPSMKAASTPGNHRTATLVFVKEETVEGLKEALFARRTVVWHENQLIGRKQYLEALFKASVEPAAPHHRDDEELWLEIRNHADIDIELERTGETGPESIKLEANSTSIVSIEDESSRKPIALHYTVKGFLIAPGKGLPVVLEILPMPED